MVSNTLYNEGKGKVPEEYNFLTLLFDWKIMPWDLDKLAFEDIMKLYEYRIAESEGRARLDAKTNKS